MLGTDNFFFFLRFLRRNGHSRQGIAERGRPQMPSRATFQDTQKTLTATSVAENTIRAIRVSGLNMVACTVWPANTFVHQCYWHDSDSDGASQSILHYKPTIIHPGVTLVCDHETPNSGNRCLLCFNKGKISTEHSILFFFFVRRLLFTSGLEIGP